MGEVERTILDRLDPSQKEAVQQIDGPVLVVAGAGSGKTRVLTSRIAYMLAKGTDPSRILALTFTKKAAAEMRERIAVMVGERLSRRLCMGTFHSVFIRFLRDYADLLGYPSSFTIYDTSDSQSAIKHCVRQLGLDEKIYKPKEVLSRISAAKNHLVTVPMYRANEQAILNDTHSRRPRLVDVYAAYQALMAQAGVMDFDDILMNMDLLLRNFPEARREICARFSHILVDEYQDTNQAQYSILAALASGHRNVCVVGDDSQSIYAFRGAEVENILRFPVDYPGCKVFRLECNYRSTKNIVGAANDVIARNANRIPKTCFSAGDDGEKIRLIQAFTEQDEAIQVAASIISRMQKDKAGYQDFAILYRTNSQSRALEEALRRRNLPYVIYSGNSFFERAEVKDMMAYFKLAVNPSDDEAFRRIVNKPARGIGDTSVEALAAAAAARREPLMKAIFADDLESCGLRPAAIRKLRDFASVILQANAQVAGTGAYELASSLRDSSGLYLMHKSDNTVEGQSRASNIEELISSVRSFVEERRHGWLDDRVAEGEITDESQIDESAFPVFTLGDYLENISLLSSVDMEDGEDSSNKISLMTVHSAKGLEYPYVYVVGLEENLFPSGGMLASPKDIEEERRLFYVAVTRAGKALTLSFTTQRMRNGKTESNPPSRFVKEIGSRYVENPLGDDTPHASSAVPLWGGRGVTGPMVRRSPSVSRPEPSAPSFSRPHTPPLRPVPPRASDADFVPVSPHLLREGQRIEHNRFGFGKILEISGTPADLKAKIVFDDYGEKILLLKYAKIRIP